MASLQKVQGEDLHFIQLLALLLIICRIMHLWMTYAIHVTQYSMASAAPGWTASMKRPLGVCQTHFHTSRKVRSK